MAATTRRPLPTLKVKKLPPPRLPSPDKSNMTTTKNGRNPDPLEKRLLNIRLHLLQNTRRRQQNPSEPTLVFESFLYLGGLKSLSNKVCTIFSFIFYSIILFFLDSSFTFEYHSHIVRCFHSTFSKCDCSKYQTSFSQSR